MEGSSRSIWNWRWNTTESQVVTKPMKDEVRLEILRGHRTDVLESMLKQKESLIEWLPRHYPHAIDELEEVKESVKAIRAELFVRRGSQ